VFVLDGAPVWSATDLRKASTCEFSFLADVDRILGRTVVSPAPEDPLLTQLARLGGRHEQAELERLRSEFGSSVAINGRGVLELTRATGQDPESLMSSAQATLQGLGGGADVLYQPAFFDGTFHGYADFVRRSDNGWVVCDTKLARHAKPAALLQLAAYADQLVKLDVPVAQTVELLLGNGKREEFRRADIEPVFRERRARLTDLMHSHVASGHAVGWPAANLQVCGSCQECVAAAEQAGDLILVAGMRMGQRRKLNELGINTLDDLANAQTGPQGMAASTFSRLRAQAEIQLLQKTPAEGQDLEVHFKVIAKEPLEALPQKSSGDLFFDFEGDPLHNEGDSSDWGLEYLWGVLTSPEHPAEPGKFLPLWADSHAEEREQLIAFLDDLVERLAEHPDLHVYHYAPYEVTALKRLTAKHKTHESVLDDLLRRGVFVDLYAVVRASVLISQPSYSIKKLEPIYMEEARSGEVAAGDVSIAEYHAYRVNLEAGDTKSATASKVALLDYNRYDCESTLGLRDWLWSLVEHDGPDLPIEAGSETAETDEEDDPLAISLVLRAGHVRRIDRSDEEQAWAMLASALGYHRRERLPAAWEYFHRIFNAAAEWESSSDVLVLEGSMEVEQDWEILPGKQTYSRVVVARAHVAPGNTVGPGAMSALYAEPFPDVCDPHENAFHAIGAAAQVVEVRSIGDDQVEVRFEERLRKGASGHSQLPHALIPGFGVQDKPLEEAIREVASAADTSGSLPKTPIIDLLARREPRSDGNQLPRTGSTRDDLVQALLGLSSSYLAVQGPPGTGKTYTGSQVIRELVEQHGWRVGVVAQSHEVVENLLKAVAKDGLDQSLIGKKDTRASAPPWQEIKKPTDFVAAHPGGCLVGGTAWTFAAGAFERECLDLLVVDEAGQFSLANTMAASVAARRLLLLGDPRQLPQVSQGTHGEPVNESALGWLMQSHAALPPQLGYFLEETYRMHPAVCEPVSVLSYAGELTSAPPAGARHLEGVEPGVQVIRVPHTGNNVVSPEEADEIVERIRGLIGCTWSDPSTSPDPRPLQASDFLVVAPYNAQRQLITHRLAAAGLSEVRVGTVDKFQGQQAPVVLVSMTASSQQEVPRGIGFLLNRNRVNVAVSRAQWLAIVVRSESLTRYMPPTVSGLLELGAFIGLCESGHG